MSTGPGLGVQLPEQASNPVRLRDPVSGLGLSFRLLGAHPQAVHPHGASALAASAGPDGGDVLYRRGPFGLEDFVEIESAAELHSIRYELELERVAGLRLVSGVLELLDAGGAPRLRVKAPAVIAEGGARHSATLAVLDCNVDTNPSPPWDRTLTRPGASTCTIEVGWSAALSGRVLVDPAWTGTASMAVVRVDFALVPLPSGGRVLAVGGDDSGSTQTSEIYDPATGSWAMSGNFGDTRRSGSVTALADGRVLYAGGCDPCQTGPLATTLLYTPSTGLWAAGPSMATARFEHMAARLVSDKVLVMGGAIFGPGYNISYSAELYDPATNAWTSVGDATEPHRAATLTALPDGRALAIGDAGQTTSTEIFDPTTRTFARTAQPTSARGYHSATLLGDGSVLVAGGMDQTSTSQSVAELFDPASNTWSPTATLPEPRAGHTATLLGDGSVLVAGGQVDEPPMTTASDAFTYATPTGNWANVGPVVTPRVRHAAAAFTGTKVLLAGGMELMAGLTSSAEVFERPSTGTACAVDGECASGFCADGVCCDRACDAPCEACSAAAKGSGSDGTCGPVAAGSDPRNDCSDEGAATCGQDGQCDGQGACRSYATSSGCTPMPCTGGAECSSGFCVDGVCCDTACDGQCEACTATKKGHGTDGVCEPVSADTDPDDECTEGAGFPKSCLSDGMCDGTGKCRDFAPEGLACQPQSCTTGQQFTFACDGAGNCQPGIIACSPYLCADAVSCGASCASDTECAEGFECNVAGSCAAPGTASCSTDLTTSIGTDGERNCGAFKCDPATGACRDSCGNTADCASGYVCDTAQGQGVCKRAESGAAEDDSGCSTTPTRTPRGAATTLGLLAVVLAMGARRRRGAQRRR